MASVNLIIENNVVKGMEGASAHVVIPEGITEIGNGAFENCGFIQTVTIDSNKFRTIGERAFSGCSSLERITIKSLGGAVGNYAFFNCSKLECVDIPTGTLEIGCNAFGSCSNLGLVRIPDSVMVIAENAFDTNFSKRLLIVCQPNTEPARYVERHNIPHRNNLQYYGLRNAYESAIERRKRVGTQTFSMFGQSIIAPNSLALKKSIINHYSELKDTFFKRVFGRLPQKYGGSSEAKKIKGDFLQYADATVARLEKNGVFTSQLHVLANAGQVLESLNNVLTSIASIINELTSMRNSHLQERLNQLQYEAESKVTGLSYGVIGDSLTLALHAVDEYRARQKQRGAAYAEAQRQYDHETQQTNVTIAENYKKILQENIRPAIRTITDAYISVLCAAELTFLINHGLMENIDISMFDENKSSEIIRRANNMDTEYAIGLALKTYPLNLEALVLAGKQNIATDRLVDYIEFMQITDEHTVCAVLNSQNVSLQRVLDYHALGQQMAGSASALALRSKRIYNQIDKMANGQTNQASAEDYQKQIEKMITAEQWESMCRLNPIIFGELETKLGFKHREADSVKSYFELGSRIATYNDRWENANLIARKIANANTTLPEKLKALYEYKDLLGSEILSTLLEQELTALSKWVLTQQLPAYDGKNAHIIRQRIQSIIADALGTDVFSIMEDMRLTVCTPISRQKVSANKWSEGIAGDYIREEQKKYADELKHQLANIKDYQTAFSAASGYVYKIDSFARVSIMKNYVHKVQLELSELSTTLLTPENASEDAIRTLTKKHILSMLDQPCWETYFLCEAQCKPSSFQDCIHNLINKVQQAVLTHTWYTCGCNLLENAKKSADVEQAKALLIRAGKDYCDCRAKLEKCEQKANTLRKKKQKNTIITISASVAAIVALIIIICAWIIPQGKYSAAEELLSEGKKAEAAMAFGALGNYSDSRERSFALWAEIADRDTLSAASGQTVAIKEDGSVVVAGENSWGEGDVSTWKDIIDVEAETSITVGLRANGTVVITEDSSPGAWDNKRSTSDWNDIVAITVSSYAIIGLKSDGTLITTGKNENGHLNVSDWENIVNVECGTSHTVGLRSDGTVIAVGSNKYGQCDVSSWTNIIAISAKDNCTVGLRADGTVVLAGEEYTVSDWENIVDVCVGFTSVIGLKSDGTVVSAGMNVRGECNVSSWTGIAKVAVGDNSFGLKDDGTVVFAGENTHGEGNVSSWDNIRMP